MGVQRLDRPRIEVVLREVAEQVRQSLAISDPRHDRARVSPRGQGPGGQRLMIGPLEGLEHEEHGAGRRAPLLLIRRTVQEARQAVSRSVREEPLGLACHIAEDVLGTSSYLETKREGDRRGQRLGDPPSAELRTQQLSHDGCELYDPGPVNRFVRLLVRCRHQLSHQRLQRALVQRDVALTQHPVRQTAEGVIRELFGLVQEPFVDERRTFLDLEHASRRGDRAL